ncbi:hypothetical protein Tam1G_1484 [Bifidobacterium imperatoris]|uniref:Uncharacterized protein n=3 Tax=Bifidobacterium imperatoris TaxID=2020965 RepID=A0A2N5IRA5_9BIFI|nr:hypothetical protein Tam1G_1484 [Bifidobacterium imperatoris]
MMRFEDYSPEMQEKLIALGNAAADAIEEKTAPNSGIPENDPDFSPDLEISRLLNRRKSELETIDARIAQMVLIMRQRGQSWETIGHKLGITGEATRLRYAKLMKP